MKASRESPVAKEEAERARGELLRVGGARASESLKAKLCWCCSSASPVAASPPPPSPPPTPPHLPPTPPPFPPGLTNDTCREILSDELACAACTQQQLAFDLIAALKALSAANATPPGVGDGGDELVSTRLSAVDAHTSHTPSPIDTSADAEPAGALSEGSRTRPPDVSEAQAATNAAPAARAPSAIWWIVTVFCALCATLVAAIIILRARWCTSRVTWPSPTSCSLPWLHPAQRTLRVGTAPVTRVAVTVDGTHDAWVMDASLDEDMDVRISRPSDAEHRTHDRAASLVGQRV